MWEPLGKDRGYVGRELMRDVTEFVSIGYDCMMTVPDRNMGLWQEVWIDFTGSVDIRDPSVSTDLPLPETNRATLNISTELVNARAMPVKGVLRGCVAGTDVRFQQEVELKANETRLVKVTPGPVMQNPRLWWPINYVEQPLYELELAFETMPDHRMSDAQNVRFGVREGLDGSRWFIPSAYFPDDRKEAGSWCVESGKKHDPTPPEANNRFLENTFLVSGADSRLAFGSRRFTSAYTLEAAVASARANRSPSDLTQLDKATAERLNDALKRVLNALSVADARLNFHAPSVCLQAIWHLTGPRKATGYWLKAEKAHYLLLDVAAPGEIRLTGSGVPVLWDFPVLRAPIRAPVARVGGAFTAHVGGPCALIIGLEEDAHPVAAL